MTDTSWQNRVTLLVNSCDAYADLWRPFFTVCSSAIATLPLPAEILLNTETKDFAFDGLNLRCVHSTAPTYGERMTDALREVKTEYAVCCCWMTFSCGGPWILRGWRTSSAGWMRIGTSFISTAT